MGRVENICFGMGRGHHTTDNLLGGDSDRQVLVALADSGKKNTSTQTSDCMLKPSHAHDCAFDLLASVRGDE